MIIIGGGKIAERKIKSLLGTGAEIGVVSPEITAELKTMADEHLIFWMEKRFSPDDTKGAFLVIAATDDKQTNFSVKDLTEEHQLISFVDAPNESDFQIPSVLRRGKLSIAISTSGASPHLAKRIREKLAGDFDIKYENYLEFLSESRKVILEKVKDPAQKQKLLTAIVSQSFLESKNRQLEFQTLLKQVLEEIQD